MPNNKRIAKNTLFLYFRMILIMGITLYTSRVILDKLGVDDYGLYNVVGGIVGMLSFINGTLSVGTMRFITYELGQNDRQKLLLTFNTAFYTHLAIAFVIGLALETVGLWYVNEKMVIPNGRYTAALITYHISVLTTIISIIQIPYMSLVMAFERMDIYAYISIFGAFANLFAVFLLSISNYDNLVLYAVLIACVNILVVILYWLYCWKNYCEAKLRRLFDKRIFLSMMNFSSWNILANLSETLNLQGILVLINLFFAPYVVAAQAIANQVSGAIMLFVSNFRTAINPQIIKLYASGNFEESKRLTLNSTVYCFELILMLGLPAIILMDKVMSVWLVDVPPYAVVFTQWIIVRQIISTFSTSFYIPMMAANKMKVNSIAAVFSGIGAFLLLYFLFKIGLGPMWIQYVGLLCALMFSMIIKPYVLYRDINYTFKEMLLCYWTCCKVTLISLLAVFPAIFYFGNSLSECILKGLIALFAVIMSSWVMLEKPTKEKCIKIISDRINSRVNKWKK